MVGHPALCNLLKTFRHFCIEKLFSSCQNMVAESLSKQNFLLKSKQSTFEKFCSQTAVFLHHLCKKSVTNLIKQKIAISNVVVWFVGLARDFRRGFTSTNLFLVGLSKLLVNHVFPSNTCWFVFKILKLFCDWSMQNQNRSF